MQYRNVQVGKLDATVHVGLPDTMCSLWQQVGTDRIDLFFWKYCPSHTRCMIDSSRLYAVLTSLQLLKSLVSIGMPVSITICPCPLFALSFLSQAGRAGRRQGASLAVILGRERELDVFYMKNPQKVCSSVIQRVVPCVGFHVQAFCKLRLRVSCQLMTLCLGLEYP